MVWEGRGQRQKGESSAEETLTLVGWLATSSKPWHLARLSGRDV